MSANNKKLINLNTSALILAYIVIIVGAYTRLTDAGLGCPDWPGCYGNMIVNNTPDSHGFNFIKAWTEMAHRYIAGLLGIMIFIIVGYNIYNNLITKKPFKSYFLPILLLVVLISQALLGMWTVTLKLLPTVVMGHLLGGFTIISLLLITLMNSFNYNKSHQDNVSKHIYKNFNTNTKNNKKFNVKIIALLCLIMVIIQIMLGGWTSANYAAIPCIDFPACNNQYLPYKNALLSAFNPFQTIGPNYEGGLFSLQQRISIQLIHRYGALLTSVLILVLFFNLKFSKKNDYSNNNYYKIIANWLLLLLAVQVSLGIINVMWGLPLASAVLHNGISCLLLLTLIVLNYKLINNH